MSGLERTLWLEDNCKVGGRGSPRSLVYGIGNNDAKYCQQPLIEGRRFRCPAYVAWKSILTRCYSDKFQTRSQTYVGVRMCDDWTSFSAFRAWWIENQADDFQLDKDILSDDRVYSPSTCLFVPSWINTFTIDRGVARGEFPIGVSYHKSSGRFVAQCNNPITGAKECLGYFSYTDDANKAWMSRKLELALELKPKMDEINVRIYPRIVEIINNAK